MSRRLLYRFEAGLDDRGELERQIEGMPAFAYRDYVLARSVGMDTERETTFAIAFEKALAHSSPSRLRAMVAQARPMEQALIETAIALAEGKVVSLLGHLKSGQDNARLQELDRSIARLASEPKRARALLSEFAASMLSADLAIAA